VIWVWDASPLPPEPADADDDAEHGPRTDAGAGSQHPVGLGLPENLGGKVAWAQL
jgi:hypothetical protein